MKNTVIYTLVGLLAPALSLLFLPLYLRYLTQMEYIIIALSNSFLAVVAIFFNIKVDQAYRTIYFYSTTNSAKQLQLFRTLFSFQLVSFIIWAFIFYFIGSSFFKLIYKTDIQFLPYTFILLVSFLVSSLNNFYFIYLQNKLKVKKFSYYVVSSTLLTHLLQLVSLVVFKLGFERYLLMGLFSNLIIFLLIYINNMNLFKIEISKKILTEALAFSLPFIPFLILYNIENQLDRFFIEKFLSVGDLAKYVVLISISSVVITLFNSVDNAIRPELFSTLSKKSDTIKLELQNHLDFYVFVGIVSLSFILFAGTNIKWFLDHEKYNGIAIYFPFIVLAFLPLLILRFLALILIFENKINKINYFSAVKIVVMSCCFYILIPIYKINGALITIGISNILNVFIFYKILETRIEASRFIYLCALLLVIFSFLLINLSNLKLVSFLSMIQFLVFVSLFIFKYWVEIREQFHQLKIKLS